MHHRPLSNWHGVPQHFSRRLANRLDDRLLFSGSRIFHCSTILDARTECGRYLLDFRTFRVSGLQRSFQNGLVSPQTCAPNQRPTLLPVHGTAPCGKLDSRTRCMQTKYLIVIEKAPHNLSAFRPTCPVVSQLGQLKRKSKNACEMQFACTWTVCVKMDCRFQSRRRLLNISRYRGIKKALNC